MKEKLLDKAKSLPNTSGCYLMKNTRDEVIYVGKAKNLKSRVSSYFNNSQKSPKTEVLVSHIRNFEFQLTANDTEAFVLENNLIKKYSPKYNIRMKDDKSYPYIAVDMNHDFPRVEYVRRPKRKKGVEVFGPFSHGSRISEILRILVKSFTLRDCTNRDFSSRKEACLLYQIKQCSAPCVDKISKNSYQDDLKNAMDFFSQEASKSITLLEKRMQHFAEREEFENAAIYRDNINSLKDFLDYSLQKNAEIDDARDVDVVAYYANDEEIDISFYLIRRGLLLGHKNFHLLSSHLIEELDTEVLNFVAQYYSFGHESKPEKIICSFDKNKRDQLKALLELNDHKKIDVNTPRGNYKSLFDLTLKNAQETQRVRLKNQDSFYLGLKELKRLLNLKETPTRLECYDVAVWQGKSPTASQITWRDGALDKAGYRYYHLAERPEGNNDFEMMKEVIGRRIKHGNLPDVFVIDGGKGQVSSVMAVLAEFELNIPVVGIAKSKTLSEVQSFKSSKVDHTDERLVIPGRSNSYILSKNPSLFKIIVSMRDEAHRFSRKLHHKKESSRVFESWLDEIPGIGKDVKIKILSQLKLEKNDLRRLSESQISQELKISERLAREIKLYLKNNN